MQPVREVYSLLMPVKDGRIIVPRAAVAEVMGYTKPKNRPGDAPEFVLGFIEWQRQQIPLVSFEAARGLGVPELGRRTRIAVVFGIGGRLKPDVFAVVTQGYPYLVRVNENVLQSETMDADEALVLARVRMANERPYIPDLERLEALIADGLGIESATGDEAAQDVPVDELDMAATGDEEEFGAAIVDEAGAGETAPEEAEVNLEEVTSFGTETNHSPELDAISEALEANSDAAGNGADEEDAGADIDLEEVTVVGVETNYSAELDDLSAALKDEGDEEAPQEADDDSFDVSGLDLSSLELESGESAEDAAPDDASDDKPDEIDISDLEFDLDDEDSEKSNGQD